MLVKILLCTIHITAHDLEVKVTDRNFMLKLSVKVVRSFNFSIPVWIYFIFGMIIDVKNFIQHYAHLYL